MAISANPWTATAATPVLKELFDAHGLNLAIDPIIIAPISTDAGNDNGVAGKAESFDFSPGQRSLKARVLTLIENNKPSVALDILQNALGAKREEALSIAPEIYDALKDAGFENDAKDLAAMMGEQSSASEKPKYSALEANNALFLG